MRVRRSSPGTAAKRAPGGVEPDAVPDAPPRNGGELTFADGVTVARMTSPFSFKYSFTYWLVRVSSRVMAGQSLGAPDRCQRVANLRGAPTERRTAIAAKV